MNQLEMTCDSNVVLLHEVEEGQLVRPTEYNDDQKIFETRKELYRVIKKVDGAGVQCVQVNGQGIPEDVYFNKFLTVRIED